MIKITSPQDEANVAETATVSGYVVFKDTPVQLYVYANDNMWWIQPPVTFKEDGRSWYGLCFFGNDKSVPGSTYVVAAVHAEPHPPGPVDAIDITDIADFIVVQRG
jgi:hypothetical protein